MLYLRPSFSLPTSNKAMTQRQWDKKVLTTEEFDKKYLKKESKMDKSQRGTRM